MIATLNEQRIQQYLLEHTKLVLTRRASAEEKAQDRIVGRLWKLMTREEKKEAERRLDQEWKQAKQKQEMAAGNPHSDLPLKDTETNHAEGQAEETRVPDAGRLEDAGESARGDGDRAGVKRRGRPPKRPLQHDLEKLHEDAASAPATSGTVPRGASEMDESSAGE